MVVEWIGLGSGSKIMGPCGKMTIQHTLQVLMDNQRLAFMMLIKLQSLLKAGNFPTEMVGLSDRIW